MHDLFQRPLDADELVRWTVAVKGRQRFDAILGEATWGVPGGRIAQIARTRLRIDPASLGVITEPGDEEAGLSPAQLTEATQRAQTENLGRNPVSRLVRPATEGLLLLYPISRASGHDLPADSRTRQRLFPPNDPNARDLIAFALSFPKSDHAATIFGQGSFDYVTGTVAWRAVE